MISTIELQEIIDNITVRPVNNSILVLIPKISDTTDSGIIKGEELIKEEEESLETFFTVIAKAPEVTDVEVGDRVFIQGNITTFNTETSPKEFDDICPDGYIIGHTMAMYVRMKI